ncbi:MAG: NADH-quinone oxidoreductase subunit NuoK [Vicinamibacteria bacterium]|nr:NADH-quinone oxidoreductase subunit NuoK [Vicinamibacteria bacterium]
MNAVLAQHALLLSAALFALGALGVFLRRNAITVLMCLELMLNAVNLAFIAASSAWQALDGQIVVFFVLTVAAAEAAVGLAIVIVLARHQGSLDIDLSDQLKG